MRRNICFKNTRKTHKLKAITPSSPGKDWSNRICSPLRPSFPHSLIVPRSSKTLSTSIEHLRIALFVQLSRSSASTRPKALRRRRGAFRISSHLAPSTPSELKPRRSCLLFERRARFGAARGASSFPRKVVSPKRERFKSSMRTDSKSLLSTNSP